jgi:hypothetical protein
MDNLGFKPERKKPNRKSLVWNLLTVLVVLGICCQSAYFLTVFNNPNSAFNLFPPPPPDYLPTLFSTVTPTSTNIPLDATWTPTASISPVPSRTKAFTWTPRVTNTPFTSATFTATSTGTQTMTPTITPNLAATATAACISFHNKFPGTPCP